MVQREQTAAIAVAPEGLAPVAQEDEARGKAMTEPEYRFYIVGELPKGVNCDKCGSVRKGYYVMDLLERKRKHVCYRCWQSRHYEELPKERVR